MNTIDFLKQCWRYYLMLESDFSDQRRYISFEESNYHTHSIELTKQYLSICSEIDVICKAYCKFLDGEKSADNIKQYAGIILRTHSDLVSSQISLKESTEILLYPWRDWKSEDEYHSPQWWSLYNKVKHQRLDANPAQFGAEPYYKSANLENVMNALAGLFSLELYFYKDMVVKENKHSITIPPTGSLLFNYTGWEPRLINAGHDMVFEILNS